MNLKNLAKNTLYHSGIYNIRCASKTSRNKRLLILMYHDFEDINDPLRSKNVAFQKPTRGDFEAHLIAIHKHFRAITVEDAIKEIRYEGGLKENSVAITFDDGYSSAYEIAYPLLKKYGMGATIYIPTDWIDGKLSLWWEKLTNLIYGFDINVADIKKLRIILDQVSVSRPGKLTNSRESRDLLFQDLSYALMKTSDQDRNRLIIELTAILAEAPSTMQNGVKPLTWDQICEMDKSGIKFGAHTKSHLNLSFADLDQAREEISSSKQYLEQHLGHKVTGFAYPYGYDIAGYVRFAPLLQNFGFEYACSSRWGSNDNQTNPFLLYRGSLPPLSSQPLLGRELYISLLLEPLVKPI
jgi:peptidoglycan/xylan/chitin deacetylase (PgdA/CDA1 family)